MEPTTRRTQVQNIDTAMRRERRNGRRSMPLKEPFRKGFGQARSLKLSSVAWLRGYLERRKHEDAFCGGASDKLPQDQRSSVVCQLGCCLPSRHLSLLTNDPDILRDPTGRTQQNSTHHQATCAYHSRLGARHRYLSSSQSWLIPGWNRGGARNYERDGFCWRLKTTRFI